MESSESSGSVRTRKSRSITFRLDTSVLEELQRDADQAEFSLNVLVNQVLRRYIEWDRYENKLGMISVPKRLMSELIEQAMKLAKDAGISGLEFHRDKMVKSAAETAFSIMKESVLFMRKKCSLWTVLSVLEEYMKVSGITSDHRIEVGRRHIFLIQHEMGENWSLFAKELLYMIFTELAEVKAEISTTPKTIKVEVIL
ncbi:MAG: hypothetical protein ACRD93_07885 [Nitrososphaeraceae archaeon]